MKNKKSLLSIGLVVLVLVLGVGYAVVSSQDLTITGSASTVDGGKMEVYFTNAESGTKSDGITATGEVTGEKPLTATITVSDLAKVGDYGEVVYTIKNDETDLNASVTLAENTPITVVSATKGTDLSEYYTVELVTSPVVVEHENSNTITIKVTLVKLPITTDESTANITVNLTASPVQP